jgi:hypothetical protein
MAEEKPAEPSGATAGPDVVRQKILYLFYIEPITTECPSLCRINTSSS